MSVDDAFDPITNLDNWPHDWPGFVRFADREHALSWLNRFRRLKVRYERRADIHEAFLSLACALICARAVGAGPS